MQSKVDSSVNALRELQMEELRMLQKLPLEKKIARTKEKIIEAHEAKGIYLSFSGGKDSTVLYHIVKELQDEGRIGKIHVVFFNTRAEYPEIVQFSKAIIKNEGEYGHEVLPKKTMRDVIKSHGYPVVSKEASNMICCYQKGRVKSEKFMDRILARGEFEKSWYRLPKKWHYLLEADFKISNKCCYYLKKKPAKDTFKKLGLYPMTGETADESRLRAEIYLKYGCNMFGKQEFKSAPLSFWTENDILKYLKEYDKDYCKKIYGDIIVNENGMYETTLLKRTGCVGCLFGMQREKGKTRYQKLYETHPRLWNYYVHTLGFKHVMDTMGLKYAPDEVQQEMTTGIKQHKLFDMSDMVGDKNVKK